VDTGTASTDWLQVERERGISVKAASTFFTWNGYNINLIDTPGHIDFSSEVERSLSVLDGAILVVSAVEGVQAQTEVLWGALQKMGIPTLIFMNKLDRIGANPQRVMEEMSQFLTPNIVPIQVPSGIEKDFHQVKSIFNQEFLSLNGEAKEAFNHLIEKLAERNDDILEKYLDGKHFTIEGILDIFVKEVKDAQLVPILYGSALKGIGTMEVLDSITQFLPSPSGDSSGPLSGIVFKIERDPIMGKMTFVRLYSGMLKNRDMVYNQSLQKQEKVTQIRKIHILSQEDTGILEAGDIGVVYGMAEARIGDVLGSDSFVSKTAKFTFPVLTVQVFPYTESDYPALLTAFLELTEEDPLLDLKWFQETRELHIKVMGKIQLEILETLLKDRYSLNVSFGPPSVIYKETPAKAGEGFEAYTMPKPCWAVLKFKIEPGERGSGLVYQSIVRKEDLLQRYQKQVEKRIPESLEQGLKGWEVTDLKITLIEGEHHVLHTHPLDFVVATPMAVMDGLRNTGTLLLEPMLEFRMTVPEEFGGRILSDLSQMRASFGNPITQSGRFTVEGEIPVATSLEYPVTLGRLTGGRGVMTTKFSGYQECPDGEGAVRERRGVNPLERSKYILSARNALN
jgi:ribosomal protection tetracycline resistance protein